MAAQKNTQQEIVQFSPQKLLAGFEHGGIIFWLIAAVVIHMVLIGATSLGYIRDSWVDPEGARKRKEQAALLVQQKEAAKSVASAPAPAAAPAAVAPVPGTGETATATPTATAPEAAKTGTPEEQALEARKNTPLAKKLEATARPDELPKGPDLGIPLDDTNKP